MSQAKELYEINNALYILTTDDDTKDKDAIRETAANRSDTQKLIEKRKSKLSQAVLLLEQDLVRKPDLRWLYAVIAVILFVCSAIVLAHVWRKRKLHKQITEEIEIKQNQVYTLSLRQKEHHRQLLNEVETVCTNLIESNNWKKELCWNNYAEMCNSVNLRLYDFVSCLNSYRLSEKEVRLCILVLLKASTEQMVDNIPYAKSGLGKFKLTTARKLGTTTREMRTFLLNLLS